LIVFDEIDDEPAGYDPADGNADWLLSTKLEIVAKFGEPRPVTASQPGAAANDSEQQFVLSVV